jgi:hypothetical protein
MSSAATADKGAGAGRRVLRGVLDLVKRVYALALMVLVLWLSWLAFEYLLVSLIFPAPPPEQIVDLPLRPDKRMMDQPPAAFTGVLSVENPRAPLAHYHRVDNWFQADRYNNCTQSGCHAPLPHGDNRATRAFLNMHATSLHCGVCHLATDARPLQLVWYDLADGDVAPPPALLRAYALLLRLDAPEKINPADDTALVDALQAAAALAQGGRLDFLAEHFAAVRPGTNLWFELRTAALAELPRHFRGEYGAKLAVASDDGGPILGHGGNTAAVQEYLENQETLTPERRAALLEQIHPRRREPTLACSDCHASQDRLLDLAQVGYPPARVEALKQPLVTQMIENIAAGETFYMPRFLEDPDEPAAP